MSDILGTEVTAASIDIDFFEEITLNGVHIAGSGGNTLAKLESLNIDISIFSLNDRTFHVDDITLTSGKIHLSDADGGSNYQHIIDHLENRTTGDGTDVTPSEWTLDLDDISLIDVTVDMKDAQSEMLINIPQLNAKLTDLPEKFDEISFDEITSKGLKFSIVASQPGVANDSSTKFPSLPLQLNITKLELSDSEVLYHKNYLKEKGGFDYNHITMSDAHLSVKDLKWGETISGEITGLTLNDNSGRNILNTSASFLMSDTELYINNIDVKTNESKIEAAISGSYRDFDALVSDITNQNFNLEVRNGRIGKKDILYFFSPEEISVLNINALADINFQGRIIFENNSLSLVNTNLDVGDKLTFRGGVNMRMNGDNTFSLNVQRISTTQDYLESLFPSFVMPNEVKNLGQLSGSIVASGDNTQVNITSVNLESGENTKLIGSGTISNLQRSNDLWADFRFEELRMNAADVFASGAVPPQLFNMGDIYYIGRFEGNAKTFKVDGDLNTDIGAAYFGGEIAFNDDYSDGRYEGAFDLKSFDLGRLLQDTTYGLVTAVGNIDGQGFDLNTLEAGGNIKAEVVEYNGQRYEDIVVNGLYSNSIFTGRFVSNDEKLKINFDGVADINGVDSKLEFSTEIERLDLTQFGIGDSILWVSGIAKGNFTGNNIDNFLGNTSINRLMIGTQNGIYTSDSTLFVTAETVDDNAKIYRLNSGFVDAYAEGSILLSEIGSVLGEYFKNYIPVEFGYEQSEAADTSIFAHQNFELDIQTKNLNPLLDVLVKEDIAIEKASLKGHFSSDDSEIDFKGNIDSLQYDKYVVENVNYFFDGRRDFINGDILVDRVTDGKNILIQEANINTSLNNKVASLTLDLFDEADSQTLSIGGNISRTTDYVINFHDTLRINENVWNFSEYNEITYGDQGLYIQDFSVSKDNQSITAYTDENENGQAIEVLMDNFILSELTSIIGKENEYFEGTINGAVLLNNVWGKPFVTADVQMKDIMLQEYAVGTLDVVAEQNTEQNTVVTKMKLDGEKNDAEVDLTYNIGDRSLQGYIDMQRLEVNTLDPFLTDILIDSEGALVGRIKVGGTPTEPDVNGKIDLVGVQTTPVFTNSRYALLDQTINIDNKSILLGDMVVVDAQNNVANLSGQILHTNLSEMYLDLRIETEKFQFLNTTPTENPLFYGDVTVDAEVYIIGPVDDIKIDGSARAIDNSKLSLSPFSVDQLDYENDFIIYADPRKLSSDSLNNKVAKVEDTFPFDVDIELSVAEDSEFEMVMNPITGDNITGRGVANLILNIKQNGDFTLFGNYAVTSGNYLFSFGPIKKKFAIEKGSRVIFNGDPLLGVLEVTAKYQANTPVYDLLALEADDFTDSQRAEAKRKRKVDVILNLTNSILQPEIKMDIKQAQQTVIGDTKIYDLTETKLNQLRTDPNELNNQVFGLMLFDNFILASSAETDLAATGTNLAISSLSGLVTSQLNKLASGLVKGVELNFDVNSYSSDFTSSGDAGLVTELGVGVTKRLFNDRLTISAGTNVDLESSSSAAIFNNLAGDFILSYQLTEDGRYNIKVFRKSNYDTVLDENSSKNGVGLNVRTEFGKVKRKD